MRGIVLVALLLAAVAFGSRQVAALSYSNPVVSGNFPDPALLRVGPGYYAYSTNSAGVNVPVIWSRDLVNWTPRGDALPELPSWASSGNTWAPVVARISSGKYLMYYTARDRRSGKQCIGVAHGSKPQGPFKDPFGRPFVCPLKQGGAIDPSIFVDKDKKRYIIWKNDGNCCGIPTWLYAQRVSPDGLHKYGRAVNLIRNDQAWEGTTVEAPVIHRQGSTYFLFYSGNNYANGDYAIGYATAPSVKGPYKKRGRWIKSKDNVIGPGGQDVIRMANGRLALAYHTWDSPAYQYRKMNVVPLKISGTKASVKGSTGSLYI
mmetsp:Transcript_5386/g.15420  ORF Transcript_5386/g.15420 Transcript_5386/m.15420 type:complete len:318 (+) Transcript_5386:978-1931(+)|eukprot:CAMPEP_0206138974 /NCGR_PEP_ID=MMETSP1473-20131121/4224_1 /ASSEMBLY_ACC=CAM_ASM_001109 /TAXON_ID=1461547 /ORGANISM="Stichococcus sp, Strain RCC1054" /LENGTH=317 /DNA_ID=CAMNT_0053532569 /DNA_START=916 /DNA_END=1869 /DNA_ORIENTATION=-